MQALDFDCWREHYDSLDEGGQVEFYNRLMLEHPEQSHFCLNAAEAFVQRSKPEYVIEIGGWDGEMAAAILKDNTTIRRWRNYEISSVPQCCTDKRYSAMQGEFLWKPGLIWSCDLLVASHVLEHLSVEHIKAALSATTANWLYADIPGAPGGTWSGATAAHITTEPEILELIQSAGFIEVYQSMGRNDDSIVRGFRYVA